MVVRFSCLGLVSGRVTCSLAVVAAVGVLALRAIAAPEVVVDPSSAGLPPLLPSAVPAPLRPDPARLNDAGTAPRRFDQSLDELVRQALAPSDMAAFKQACRGGALSARECRGGIALRWGRRSNPDGNVAWGGRVGSDGLPLPPLTVPVSALLAGNGGSFNLASVFRVTPRPAPVIGNGNRSLLLPIIGSAVNTSGFGWRLHPLLGAWRLHAGEDLAAPEGTPVVAALSGRVVSSGLAGGYGLAVEVEHQRPLRRTLYGHLSELYVKAGDVVRQGEVIGRVGSTGLSTGPHLHFELREPAAGGWVAIDPGDFDPGSGLKGTDAIALLMGQLLQSLERPQAKA
jgi:murein DD-endopeptidase MepM/ murein hydrolase activator NlpD